MSYELAIVIINYKTPAMTAACIQSVLPQIADRNRHIVVVDNDSADGSVETLRDWITHCPQQRQITLLPSTRNLGFSGGNNLGMRAVEADHYLLLNSDTLVRDAALDILLETCALAPEIGLVSPRLEDEDGTAQISCFRFHTPISEFIDIANTGLITRLLRRFNTSLPLETAISYPQWTSFACILLRRAMIDDVGPMDEGYFLYYEDSDYCRMARAKHWLVANNPAAHVVHFRGGSAELKKRKKAKLRLPGYYFNSRCRYFRKHYGRSGLLLANLLWMLGRSISLTRELIQRKPRAASERQWLDIWLNHPRPVK